jgi:hypothetical protein
MINPEGSEMAHASYLRQNEHWQASATVVAKDKAELVNLEVAAVAATINIIDHIVSLKINWICAISTNRRPSIATTVIAMKRRKPC